MGGDKDIQRVKDWARESSIIGIREHQSGRLEEAVSELGGAQREHCLTILVLRKESCQELRVNW